MITINSNRNIIIKIEENEYNFLNHEEYEEFILLITDPTKSFPDNYLEIDPDLEGEQYDLCKAYSDFFKEFLKRKQTLSDEEQSPSS